jgi:hypothetical protein
MTVETKREPASQVRRDPGALGLCCTCIHVDLCTSRATWVGPVHHCEEFDDSDQDAKQPSLKAVPQPAVETAQTPSASKRSGLCINCAHRDSCTFPIVEGGVWHCEEYE